MTKKTAHRRWRIGAVLSPLVIVGILPTAALAQEWRAGWPHVDGGSLVSAEMPLVLTLPPEASPELLSSLAVEVDGFDVTSYARSGDGELVVSLPEPLKSGDHNLRLVEYRPDGPIERGNWVFQSEGSGVDLTLSGNISGEYIRRIAENNLSDPKPGLDAGKGTIDTSAVMESGDWTLAAEIQAIADSHQDQTITGDVVEGNLKVVADFQGQNLNIATQLGRHGIKADNFVMSGFQRRGASLTSTTKKDRLSVSAFAFKPEDAVEFNDMLGLGSSDNRIGGAHVTWRPFERWQENIILSGTYFSGEGNGFGQNGYGQQGYARQDSGGYAMAADTYWLDNRLYIAGEVAETENNFGFGDQESDARSAEIRYALLQNRMLGDNALNMNVGVKYDEVGTLFSSLANQGLSSDIETLQYYSTAYYGGLSAQFQASRITNNVDDYAAMPTDRLWNYQFAGNYTPGWSDPPGWLGTPSFYVNGLISNGERISTPLGFFGFDYDQRQSSVSTGVTTNYDGWSMSVGYGYASFEDKTGFNSDTVQHSVDMGLSFSLWDRLSLNPYIRWSGFEDQDFSLEDDNWDVSLSGQFLWIPETLDTSFNATANLQSGDNAFGDFYTANAATTWVFLKPEPNRPGAAIDISAAFQSIEPIFGIEFEQFQAFARLKLMMPVQYPN